MSFFQNAENRINKQFISIFDSVKFIAEHGQGTLEQSFTYLDSALLKKQTHLLKVTAYTVKSVYLCSEYDYAEIPPFMTTEQVKSELWACVERNSIGDGNPIFNLGFAKKRFFEQLKNTGFPISDDLLLDTLSPDFDDTNLDDSDSFAFYQSLPNEYQVLQRSYDELKARLDETQEKYYEIYSGGLGLSYVYMDKFERNDYEKLKAERDKYGNVEHKLETAYKEIERLNKYKIDNEKVRKNLTLLIESRLRNEMNLNSLGSDNNELNTTASQQLAIIMDKDNDKHAPDLAHAINLWLSLYNVGSKSQDSHTNRANNWIKNNTGYSENDSQTINRIREITTPLIDWSSKRSREQEK